MPYSVWPTAATRATPAAAGITKQPSVGSMALAGQVPGVLAASLGALVFPSNVNGNENNLAYTVIRFDRPDQNGLPFWGPSGAGVTVIRRIKVIQQPGYYAQLWYTRGDGTFDGFTWGAHPYPIGGGTSTTTHEWEIPSGQQDFVTTNGGGALTVTKNQWYIQALRVTRSSSSSKQIRLYCDLPSVASSNIIDCNWTTELEGDPTAAQIIIGDSPWYASFQNERASCYHGQIKIIAKSLSEADILSEAANFNSMVTADGIANIWWGKKGFASVNDLTCDFGTGRSFSWANANKGTLGSLT